MKKVMSILVCIFFLGFLNACSHNEPIPNYNNESIIMNKSYIVDNELLKHDGDKISWELEYPVLNNESNYYYTGNYEITEQTENIVSLCYVISVFYEYGANPTEYCYDLTIDIDTGEKIAL